MHNPRLVALALGVVAATSACHESGAPPARVPAPQLATTSAPFDVGAIMRQVHFAFRPDDAGGWSAGHSTWTGRVAGGAFELTPFHAPPGQPGRLVEGTPARFGPARIARGTRALAKGALRAGNGPTGGLELDRAGVTERYDGREDGVEVSWRFAQKPAGTGPLEVRLPTTSTFRGATESGLHFAAGPLLVRVGQGTWVDASGRRTHVPARFERGTVVFRVPANVVEASTFPAVLDPVFGPEFGLDQPVTVPTEGDQTLPDIAAGDTSFLVVWNDSRKNLGSGDDDIYAARVSFAGNLLDPAGISVCNAANAQLLPAVGWNGLTWLVAWQDLRGGLKQDIYAARVGPDGTVADRNGFPITPAAGGQYEPAVASNGQDFLVVWQGLNGLSEGDIIGARVRGNMVLDAPVIDISVASGNQTAPDVAWDGTNYLVVWQDYRNGPLSGIFAAQVTPGGAVVQNASTGIQVRASAATAQVQPAVASNSTVSLVVWSAGSGSSTDVYGVRVDSNGAVLGTNPTLIGATGDADLFPAVEWDGFNFLVAWQAANSAIAGIQSVRVSSAGPALDLVPAAVARSSQAAHPAIAAGAGTSFVVWEAPGRGTDLYGSRVSNSNIPLDSPPVLLTSAANPQSGPAIAAGGGGYLVVWKDGRVGESDIYGARVDLAGRVLDPAGIAICTDASAQAAPAVAWTGSEYLVVWEDFRSIDSDIYGGRISLQGAVLDGSGFAICSAAGAQLQPRIASNRSGALVVWTDARATGQPDIYGRLVDGLGSPVGTAGGVAISSTLTPSSNPAVASDGLGYMVVWNETRSTSGLDVVGTRVDATSGVALDSPGINVNTNGGAQQAPDVVYDGTGWFVVWHDIAGSRIAGARVGGNGNVVNGAGLPLASSVASVSGGKPRVAFDGVNTVITWLDSRAPDPGLSLARYSPANMGTLLDPAGIPVTSSASPLGSSAIACTDGKRCLLAWDAFSLRDTTNARRVVACTFADTERPVAEGQQLDTREDTPLAITLTGSDPDGDTIRFFATQPMNGTLAGLPPAVTYTPAPDFNGTDTFAFVTNDGLVDSVPATVTIAVTPVNDPPVATAQEVATPFETPVGLTLSGTDVDGDALTFEVKEPPQHGTLEGTPPDLTYTPGPGYAGEDRLVFTAHDQALDGAGEVQITVGPPPRTGDVVVDLTRGCGCGAAAPVPAFWLAALALARARRQRRLRADPTKCPHTLRS